MYFNRWPAREPALFSQDPMKAIQTAALFPDSISERSLMVEAAVYRFLADDTWKTFAAHWEETKQHLGVWTAGATLKAFIENNTREIQLDPWQEVIKDGPTARDTHHVSRISGSDNPLTYDCLLVRCKLAPSTTKATILHTDMKSMVEIGDNMVLFRRGQWCYDSCPPIPGEGKMLEDWEYIRCFAARFTMPFETPQPSASALAQTFTRTVASLPIIVEIQGDEDEEGSHKSPARSTDDVSKASSDGYDTFSNMMCVK